MHFYEMESTPYDLRWRMFGIPVRVHPLFWLITLMLGWDLFHYFGLPSLLTWVLAVFVSILLHELGHVLVGRLFGSHGSILLYSFGGLAIGSTNLARSWQRVLVLLAGPGIQLALWAALLAIPQQDPVLTRNSPPAAWLLEHLIYINLWWALLNLLPIYPLDGGQIVRELCTWVFPRDGVRYGGVRFALGLSIVTAAGMAVWALTQERPRMFQGLFFAYFAVINVQLLLAERQRGRFPDDPPWMR